MLKLAMLLVPIMLVAFRAQAEKIGNERITRPPGMVPHKFPKEIPVEEHFHMQKMMENEGVAYFLQKAVRKKASRKAPKKLSELSKGLRSLKLPCKPMPDYVTVEAGETVIFSSPKCNNKYPNNVFCGWFLEGGTPTTRFNITCQKFKVVKRNNDGECLDYLYLEGDQFCGKTKADRPTGWLSTDWSEYTYFFFISNEKKREQGFTCTATAYIRDSLTTESYSTYPH